MYTIYALVDPRDHTTRYIGITDDVYSRFSQHVQCKGDNPEKDAWIIELRAYQLMVIMQSIETAETFAEAREREDHWIHYHLSNGAKLLNQQIANSFTFDAFSAMMRGEEPQRLNGSRLPAKAMSAHKIPSSLGGRRSVTVKEAAHMIGCSETRVRELRSQKRLHTPARNKKLILIRSIRAFVESKRDRVS